MSELHRKKLKKDEADLPNLTSSPIRYVQIYKPEVLPIIRQKYTKYTSDVYFSLKRFDSFHIL